MNSRRFRTNPIGSANQPYCFVEAFRTNRVCSLNEPYYFVEAQKWRTNLQVGSQRAGGAVNPLGQSHGPKPVAQVGTIIPNRPRSRSGAVIKKQADASADRLRGRLGTIVPTQRFGIDYGQFKFLPKKENQ